jgi:hypothetical protein
LHIFILTPDTTERSYYEEQVLSPDKKHEGMDILVSEKAPPRSYLSTGGRCSVSAMLFKNKGALADG